MSLEQPSGNEPPKQETFGAQETPEQKKERIIVNAKRAIKHALWDFESRGGEDISDFLMRSDEFRSMQSTHASFFKSNAGIAEAIQYVKELRKKSTPEATLNTDAKTAQLPPQEKTPADTRFIVSVPETIPENKTVHVPKVSELEPLNVQEQPTDEITLDTQPAPAVEIPKSEVIKTNEISIQEQPKVKPVPEVVVREPVAPVTVPTVEPDVPSVQESNSEAEEVMQVSPSDPPVNIQENTLENHENEVEYIQTVKNIASSYTTFIDKLIRYNETTLDRDGSESSESILRMEDLLSIKNDIDIANEVESTATAEEAFGRIQRAREFLMNNVYPIHQGVALYSHEGFDTLSDSLAELRLSLASTYQRIEDKSKETGITTLIRQLDDDVEKIDTVQKKKRVIFERHW